MLNAAFPATLRDRRAWPWLALAVLAFIAGVWLRLWQLRTQVLIDDEWHAVRMLIGADAKTIATHFGFADYCIPLTLYYRWLYDHGALSEWQMHLPLAIAGIATLVVLPWLMRDRLAWPTRAVWLALLAISPLLVYLSRTARPYALDCLCAFVAIVAFERWQREKRAAWAVAYVVATVAAAWLHLLTIVFTLWPFVWFGVPALRDAWRRSPRELGRIAVIAVATIAGLALVLAPPLVGDWRAMAAKAGAGAVEGDTLYRALLMVFGISSPALAVVMTIVLALGVWRLWMRDRRFAAYVLSMSVAGVVTIALSHAAWVQHAADARALRAAGAAVRTAVRRGGHRVRRRATAPAGPRVCGRGARRGRAHRGRADSALLLFSEPADGSRAVPARLRRRQESVCDAARARAGAGVLPRSRVASARQHHADRNAIAPDLELLSGSSGIRRSTARTSSTHSRRPCAAARRTNIRTRRAAPRSVASRGSAISSTARPGAGIIWCCACAPWSVPPGLEQAWPDMAACEEKVAARLGEPVYRDKQIAVFSLKKK